MPGSPARKTLLLDREEDARRQGVRVVSVLVTLTVTACWTISISQSAERKGKSLGFSTARHLRRCAANDALGKKKKKNMSVTISLLPVSPHAVSACLTK